MVKLGTGISFLLQEESQRLGFKKKKNTDNNVKLFFKKLSYICFFIRFCSL